jgi:signal transduction histidine kinase
MVADQAALAIENDRIRTRARRAAVTAERTRIARDLHDSVSQTLFSANLISEVLPRVWAKNPEAGNERLEELQQLTRGALAEMRSLLLELRPNVLREVPLPELLRQLGDAFEGRARVPLELTVDAMPDLPPDVRIALYRTAQEALNNVARHARAGEAKMSLRQDVDGASLIIEDDGGGFRPEAVSAGHLGLQTMRERAEDIGAALSVTSRPGGGTKVWVRWSRSKTGLVFASEPTYEPSQPTGTTNADADGTERTNS